MSPILAAANLYDWSQWQLAGTGAHTNYSTKSMREDGGIEVINQAIEKLAKTHAEHIVQYGLGNELRLTGKHEVNIARHKT